MRPLLPLALLASLAACKGGPKKHTEDVGDTGWVIDVGKDYRVRKTSVASGDWFDISSGTSVFGSVFLRPEGLPDEGGAAAYCSGAEYQFETVDNGVIATCRDDSGWRCYAFMKGPDGSVMGADWHLATDRKDARAVCASLRRKK